MSDITILPDAGTAGLGIDQPPEALAGIPGIGDGIARAARGRDVSVVHWRFLGHLLRHMPKQEPAVQTVIDPVIEGMDLLSAGKDWPGAQEAADAASSSRPIATSYAARAAWAAAWAAADAAMVAKWVALTAEWAFLAAWGAADEADSYYTQRNWQKAALFKLITDCPETLKAGLS